MWVCNMLDQLRIVYSFTGETEVHDLVQITTINEYGDIRSHSIVLPNCGKKKGSGRFSSIFPTLYDSPAVPGGMTGYINVRLVILPVLTLLSTTTGLSSIYFGRVKISSRQIFQKESPPVTQIATNGWNLMPPAKNVLHVIHFPNPPGAIPG